MSSKENSEVNPIEQWQESVPDGEAPPSPTENNHGLTGQLSTNASSLFLSTMKSGKDHFSEEVLLRIRREYGYFQLWCDGYGVLSGELDDILAGATRLRNSTYRSLVDVCQALLGRKSPSQSVMVHLTTAQSKYCHLQAESNFASR